MIVSLASQASAKYIGLRKNDVSNWRLACHINFCCIMSFFIGYRWNQKFGHGKSCRQQPCSLPKEVQRPKSRQARRTLEPRHASRNAEKSMSPVKQTYFLDFPGHWFSGDAIWRSWDKSFRVRKVHETSMFVGNHEIKRFYIWSKIKFDMNYKPKTWEGHRRQYDPSTKRFECGNLSNSCRRLCNIVHLSWCRVGGWTINPFRLACVDPCWPVNHPWVHSVQSWLLPSQKRIKTQFTLAESQMSIPFCIISSYAGYDPLNRGNSPNLSHFYYSAADPRLGSMGVPAPETNAPSKVSECSQHMARLGLPSWIQWPPVWLSGFFVISLINERSLNKWLSLIIQLSNFTLSGLKLNSKRPSSIWPLIELDWWWDQEVATSAVQHSVQHWGTPSALQWCYLGNVDLNWMSSHSLEMIHG